jgi:hypothetical protein
LEIQAKRCREHIDMSRWKFNALMFLTLQGVKRNRFGPI